jgi:hypothetical protein
MGCAIIGAIACGVMPGFAGAGWSLLMWLLLTLAVLDWRHFWLPDALTLPLAFLGLTAGLWVTDPSLPDRLIGAAGGLLSYIGRREAGRAWDWATPNFWARLAHGSAGKPCPSSCCWALAWAC